MAQGTTNLIQKDTGDGTILILPWNYSGITQGTWAFSISSSFCYFGVFCNTSATLNDQIDYKVWMSKGAWSLMMEVYCDTHGPILDILIDSIPVAELYLYDQGTGYNRRSTQSFNIATTGLKTLSIKLAGTVTAYYLYCYSILLQRAI
jgi:hypothetical protein